MRPLYGFVCDESSGALMPKTEGNGSESIGFDLMPESVGYTVIKCFITITPIIGEN